MASDAYEELVENRPFYPVPILIDDRILGGPAGNAYALLGWFASTAKRTPSWCQEDIDIVLKEAKSGDYNHLVATLREFSLEVPEDDS